MKIIYEYGLNRHIRFMKPETINMQFDIITWPGYLCFTGDMGTYVFKRLTDMFEFFRDRERLRINPGYWGEKLQAIDKTCGYREWDREKFKALITKDFQEWLEDAEPTDPEAANDDFNDQILDRLDVCSKDEAYAAVRDFAINDKTVFPDWWEISTDEYTYHYLWACYAIVFGIQKYDAQITQSKTV